MEAYIHRITVYGHRFVLKVDHEPSNEELTGWFDDIVECLKQWGISLGETSK